VESFETHEHDVLVIGAGGAGLRATIEAAAQGVSVGLVCKSLLGKAHTVMAEGGVAAAMGNVDRQDNWQVHFRDTMLGGKMLNNWRMAQLHAQQAPDRVHELEHWGALFDRTPDGNILQRAFGGHTYKRLAHVGDRTGLEMIRTLQDRAVQLNVPVYMECTLTHLFKAGERVCGALAYWREQGRFVLFLAKAVILATGGVGKAFRITSNSWEYTSDGLGMAYHLGAKDICTRSAAFGMPAVMVDGTDFFAVYDAMGVATQRARAGEGPSTIECVAPRWRGHFEGDAQLYRDLDEIKELREKKDCLKLFRERVRKEGKLEAHEMDKIDQEVLALIDEAVEAAKIAPHPKPEDLLTDVYVSY